MEYYIETPPSALVIHDIEFFTQIKDRVSFSAAAHVHTAVEILYIIEGDFLVDADGVQSEVHAGDLVLFRSNTVHSVYHLSDEPGRYQVLKLTTSFLLSTFRDGESAACVLPLLKKQADIPFVYSSEKLTYEIREIWAKMLSENLCQKQMIFQMIKAQSCELIVLMYRTFFSDISKESMPASDNILSLIYQSVGYINENYASDLSPYECARMVNLSYSYYAKVFRDVIGKSFTEYLIDIRLAKAHNILLFTDLSVTDVATSCGYRNPAHFAAEYKKRYGITPGETRKRSVKICRKAPL